MHRITNCRGPSKLPQETSACEQNKSLYNTLFYSFVPKSTKKLSAGSSGLLICKMRALELGEFHAEAEYSLTQPGHLETPPGSGLCSAANLLCDFGKLSPLSESSCLVCWREGSYR